MSGKRILTVSFAAVILIGCAGCATQELSALGAGTASTDHVSAASPELDTGPPVSSGSSSDSVPTAPALDPMNGHILIPIGPGTYIDTTNGMVYPPGFAIPLGGAPQ